MSFRFGIGHKLVASLSVSLFFIFGILTYENFQTHRKHLEKAVINSALRIADTIQISIQHHMLRDECSEAFEVLNTLSTLNGIDKIRLFNAGGLVMHSTNKKDIGSVLNKSEETCLVCHNSDKPLRSLSKRERWRIFKNPDIDKYRIVGLISPIKNEKSCSTADCHYHPAETEILGILDVNMTLEDVDKDIAGDVAPLVTSYLITMLLVAIISIIFVLHFIHGPIKKLITVTRQAALGDLDQHLDVRSDDELGELGSSFNQMMQDLQTAQEAASSWALTLEEKVKEKADELNRTYAHMVHSEKMISLGKLAAIVAHEINNPLAGVLTYTKLIKKQSRKWQGNSKEMNQQSLDDVYENLTVMEKELMRCGEIITNLLHFAKKSGVDMKENNINEIILRSVKLIQHQLDLNSIEMKKELDPSLPAVRCDQGQIQQIVIALLINSIEAIGQEGEIRITTAIAGDNQEKCQIIISDNGCGIDTKVRDNIFDPFFTTKEGTNGAGLGLSVVFGIVEKHGGSIEVESNIGTGSTFTITLLNEPPEPELIEEIPDPSRHVNI